MKIKSLLVAVIVMFVFTTVQAQIGISSTPVTAIRADGLTEKTGDVLFTFNANTPASGGDVLTLDYGVAVDISSVTTSVVTLTGTTVGTITKSGNIVSIPLTFTNAATGSLTLKGVRVKVSGTTLTELNVSISTSTDATASTC